MGQLIPELVKEINQIEVYPKNHRFKQLESFIIFWSKVFSNEEIFKESDYILDFGCASGFSIFTGQLCGLDNIYGLEVDFSDNNEYFYPLMRRVSEIIGVNNKIKLYKGYGELPFEDNTFDYIISNDAITKDMSEGQEGRAEFERMAIRIHELNRITKPDGQWIIRPPKHITELNNYISKLKLDSEINIVNMKSLVRGD